MLQLADRIISGPTPGIGPAPAPLNFWRATIERHLATPAEWGKLHIMVVNTSSTFSLTEEAPGTISGVHWFVMAWWLNAEDPPLPWEQQEEE